MVNANEAGRRKGGTAMATTSFDKTFVVKDEKAFERLVRVMETKPENKARSVSSFTPEERERSERILKECLSRSNL